ncbi:hypothetical protein PYW08_009442 [Mythimna loreyi]|uniref:Uncharacterized protein n=1 Tax=Mythimna loreyi TaxID=667449 RepID=A0ACC2Q969_9NEOP|nr:hypothetical protein PYW08_009442 [Mythimna loreyi]
MVNEILNKMNFDVYRKIKGTEHKHTKGKILKKDESKGEESKEINPAFEDSKEFAEFVIKFLSKVNNLTIHDFKKNGHIYKYNRLTIPSKNNLKAWEAPSNLIYDLEENDTRRIFRGSKTRVNSYPFMVSIHIMGEFTCSGCIISRDFVITAASCLGVAYKSDFFERNLKSIYVRLVSDHTTRGGETIPVQNLYFHPQFEPKHLQNNLAIIRLEKRIRFSRKQKKIRRILWDKTPGDLSNETKQILILGWCAKKEGQVTQKLRLSMLDVYNTTDCRKKYTEDFITKENFCAAYNGTNGSACNGDVGGPGIVNGTLMGVVSFGAPECGAAGMPTVFTKLGYYLPWIESVLNTHKKINQSNHDNTDARRRSKHSSKKLSKVNKPSNNGIQLQGYHNELQGHYSDNPEEDEALRDTLLELVNDDESLIHDVIYGDMYDEFNKFFKSSEESDFKKNSLSRKKKSTSQPTPSPLLETDFKKNSMSRKKKSTTHPTPSPLLETDFKKNSMSRKKKSTTQPTPSPLLEIKLDIKPESENQTTTQTPMHSTVLILWKNPEDSDYETYNGAVQNDYSDNYEKSCVENTEEELGLTIEVPPTSTIKTLRIRENGHGTSCSSNSESKSDSRVSDESTDYSDEIRECFETNRDNKQSNKGRDAVDRTRSNQNGRGKRTKEVLIKHDQFSKHARSVLDEGKSFATKFLVIDYDDKDVKHILIEEFIDRLDNLKEKNELQNNTKFDINKAILKYFNNHENELGNITYIKEKHVTGNDSDNNVLDSIESWHLSGRRIFEGIRSNIQKFPFMASVQFFKKFQCGGSIIKSDLVITSASCLQLAWNNRLFRENPLFLSVQVGSTSYERGGENVPVLEVHFHPSYNPKNLRHNLALMRLTRTLKFMKRTKSKIKKIDFDRNPWPLPPNAGSIIIVGWGARIFGTNMVSLWKNKLTYAVLDFYPLPECQEIYGKEFVTDRNFCAGFFSKGSGACNHDAGGPGVLSGILTGVISFGSTVCGTRDAPTVFTKLGYYTDWIEGIMEQEILTGNQPTTQRDITFSTFIMPTFKRTTPFKVTPIVFEDPLRVNRFESLRTDDKKHEFNDFAKTMFKKKQDAKHKKQKKQENEQEKETGSLLADIAQDVKEEDQTENKQVLRQDLKIETEEESKPLSPNSKVTIEVKIESQSHSEENLDDETTTIRIGTFFEVENPFATALPDNYEPRASSTPYKNDENENANSSKGEDFDEAIENLLDNLDIDTILESESSSPKDQHQMRAKDQLENKEDRSDAIKNENESKGDSGKDLRDEGDSFGEKNNEQNVNDSQSVNKNENKKDDSGKDVSDEGDNISEKNYEQDDDKNVNKNKNTKGDSGKDMSEEGDDYSEKNSEQDVNGDKTVNKNENKKGDSGKDLSDEGDNLSEKNNEQDDNDDKSAEITDGSEVVNSVEDYSDEKNIPSKEVGLKATTVDDKKDYESGDESKKNEGFKGFGIPTESLEREHSSNSSERLLEMLDYEDLYKLLMKDT